MSHVSENGQMQEALSPRKPSKEAVAEELARAHYDVDRDLEVVIRLLAPDEGEADDSEPIKLLEVNQATVPAGIQPVYFGSHPASGMVYPSVVVEITPDEFNETTLDELEKRFGWRRGPEIYRRAG
jgi:hypothetical protein